MSPLALSAAGPPIPPRERPWPGSQTPGSQTRGSQTPGAIAQPLLTDYGWRTLGVLFVAGNASGAVPAFPVLKLIGKSAFVCRPKLLDYTATRAELDYRVRRLCRAAPRTLSLPPQRLCPSTQQMASPRSWPALARTHARAFRSCARRIRTGRPTTS